MGKFLAQQDDADTTGSDDGDSGESTGKKKKGGKFKNALKKAGKSALNTAEEAG